MKIENNLKYAEEPSLDDLFVVKKANEWMMQARGTPMPRMLFGELWIEGELAVLTGAAGLGKSLLAVQIAESIARGAAIGPLQITARPQKVLYLDLKLSAKQFESRYAAEHDDEKEFLTRHYKFSDRLHRVEIDLDKPLPDRFRSAHEVVPHLVEKLAAKTGARVVIIDSLTHVQHSIYGYRETHYLMKELRRLKRELGLSILVLARPIGTDREGLERGGSQFLTRFADSVFTIRQSKQDAKLRYIRHITAHGTGVVYDASHVPLFRISRLGGNFLGFGHEGFAAETSHVADVRDHRDWPTIQRIKEMSDTGMSIREIAVELDLPKTSVHRMLQMWTPEDPKAAKNPYEFPGCEEYDAAKADPRFQSMSTGEGEEDHNLRREYNLLENARHLARKEYLKTGKAPTLAEMLARTREEKPAAMRQMDFNVLENGNNGHEDPVLSAGYAKLAAAGFAPPDKPALKCRLDGYGHEMWVEKEDGTGKPLLWYTVSPKGVIRRRERQPGGGIICQTLVK